jgi:hypothetical protein
MNTQIANNRQDFERKVARIRANPDLNDEARCRMIEEAYKEADARHQELAGEQRREENERILRLERGVMGIRYPYGLSEAEEELVRMSYRDAYDRAERAASAGDADNGVLSTLLERAERSGDPRLAEAVYHVATERGLRGVADSYLEGRPAEKKKWEEYAAARQEAGSAERLLFGTGDHGPIKPAELDGYAVRAPSSAAASG